MGRRKRSSVLISLLVVAIFSASLGYIFGYYTYNRPPEISEIENHLDNNTALGDENSNMLQTDDRTVTSQNEIVNNQTKLIIRTYYERCKENVDNEGSIENEMIGLNEVALNDYISNNIPQYDLLTFSKEEIVLLEKKDEVCPKHYLVTEHNGFIIVYRYNENGQRVVYQETRIPISILPPVDQEKLKNGIVKNSEAEVTSLLEDYS